MAAAPPAELSHIRHCKRFPLSPLRLLEHSFQTFHIRGKPLNIRRVLLYQQEDKLKHSRFNPKLKTVPSLPAQFFHSLNTVRRLSVSFFLQIEPHRGKKFSGGDRHQIFSRADIRRARASKIHPEYDIFVFHGISMLLINGVERSRRDHKNISLPGGILFHSHLYPAAAFFHIDQFHFVMPVKHHGRKVQGNGTGINIKRKKPAAVPLCFLKLFLLI